MRPTAHLAINCLNYSTVLDGAESLKGSHRMGDGQADFSKKTTSLPLRKINRMSLISAGSMSDLTACL